MFFTEDADSEFVLYHQRSNIDKHKDFFDEETNGIDVPMPTDTKVIEDNNSPDDLQLLQYDDLKENRRYRVQIQYHTWATNTEKKRAIMINSNINEFEFIHQVIVLICIVLYF